MSIEERIKEDVDSLNKFKQGYWAIFINKILQPHADDPTYPALTPVENAGDAYSFALPGATGYLRLLWDGKAHSPVISYGFLEAGNPITPLRFVPVCFVSFKHDGRMWKPNLIGVDVYKEVHSAALEKLCDSVKPDLGVPLGIES